MRRYEGLMPDVDNWREFDEETIMRELIRCSEEGQRDGFGLPYFVNTYVKIFSPDERGWITFNVWDTDVNPYDNQEDLLNKMFEHNRLAVLKSRQLGASWLSLSFTLWAILFTPIQSVLILSKGETEAIAMLERLKKMYDRLPRFLQADDIVTINKRFFEISNGSAVRSVSTRGGDSYQATICIVDEADLIHRSGTSLSNVMLNVEPTLGIDGKLILISKSDKSRPDSTFKNIYRSAEAGENSFTPIFLPYNVHPARDEEFYERKKADSLGIDGTLDNLHESYPATPEDALAPKTKGKRLAYSWLKQCYHPMKPLVHITAYDQEIKWPDNLDESVIEEISTMVGLKIYAFPVEGADYIVSADPAQGLPTSDPSPLHVVNKETGEECALLREKLEPATLAALADKLGKFYNNARVMPERNNHGHTFIFAFQENSHLHLLNGWDVRKGKKMGVAKAGWLSSTKGKTMAYDVTAEKLKNKDCIIHDATTLQELSNIETATLKAPSGMHDDVATTFSIALASVKYCWRDFNFSVMQFKES